MRALWRLRAGVALSLALAVLAALWSVNEISLSAPWLKPRALEMATASTHVIVDTPDSTLLDLRQDTYSIEGLTNRAVVLGNVMASSPVRESIARRAGVSTDVIQIAAPLTRQQPQARVESGREKRMSDIVESTDQYNVSIQANPTVPMLDIYTQTPTAESATALANAAVDELRRYLSRLATTQQTPLKEQIRLVQLGRAEGSVINASVHWQVAFLAFLITFAVSCATVIFLARVRDGWRLAEQLERTAKG